FFKFPRPFLAQADLLFQLLIFLAALHAARFNIGHGCSRRRAGRQRERQPYRQLPEQGLEYNPQQASALVRGNKNSATAIPMRCSPILSCQKRASVSSGDTGDRQEW